MWIFGIAPNGVQFWAIVAKPEDVASLCARSAVFPKLTEDEYRTLYYETHKLELGHPESS